MDTVFECKAIDLQNEFLTVRIVRRIQLIASKNVELSAREVNQRLI